MTNFGIAHTKSFVVKSFVLLQAILFAQLCFTQSAVAKDNSFEDTPLLSDQCRTGPWIKNLTAPGVVPCPPAQAGSNGISRKEIEKFAATASTSEDHLQVSAYYRTEADRLEAQANQYEKAAWLSSSGPKNLVAPGTAARYTEYAAKLRQQATDENKLADDQEEMAKKAAGESVKGVGSANN